MLGLLLLYFIGRYFYDLAGKHEKNQWVFAIVGIVAYYAGTFFGGIALVIIIEIFELANLDEFNERAFGIMALPFGILACWGMYVFLKKQWEKQPLQPDLEILDDEFLE